jgi:DNA-binding MarR family transcriptional regulator
MKKRRLESRDPRQEILHHWREAVPNDRLAHLVRDAGRSCVRALQMRLAERSISFGHWTFLRILWQADGLTQRELSARAGVMEPTAVIALRSMEKLGYVTRKQAPGSRKKLSIRLTARGRALRKELEPLAKDVNKIAVHGVEAGDILTTRRTLLSVIENLAADELAAKNKARRTNGELASDG